ncbi:hypothetical protein BLA29_015018 [Euroglyphus maynei]|uniref:Uncharacterized protein n=1 Tax=Euroglyphus maynei TaxID=6958 RepID=A0A1Y3BQA5_EURMA|nr:hypothetical protein BLA29_015018 [Euroglyphus maynei]
MLYIKNIPPSSARLVKNFKKHNLNNKENNGDGRNRSMRINRVHNNACFVAIHFALLCLLLF